MEIKVDVRGKSWEATFKAIKETVNNFIVNNKIKRKKVQICLKSVSDDYIIYEVLQLKNKPITRLRKKKNQCY
jgi:hypothetical protein